MDHEIIEKAKILEIKGEDKSLCIDMDLATDILYILFDEGLVALQDFLIDRGFTEN